MFAQSPPVAVAPQERVRETDVGPEKFCPRCDDWCPADKELFYCCKACYHEMDRRLGRRRAVESAA
jgi:hypothetical protein